MDRLTFEKVFNANLKTIIKNHNEWHSLITSKKVEKIELLESYKKEFKAFKSQSSIEYATITIDNMIKNSKCNIDITTRNNYITLLLRNFKRKI